MPASFPSSVKTFTTKNAGDSIAAAHINDLQDEVNAIEAGIRNGTAPVNSSNSTVTTLSVSGGQITFPATQAPSSGANTLDDYEEGTWTPVLGGTGGSSGQTYGTQAGFYIKVGKLVMATYDITLSAKGTITGNCQIEGLPFTSDAGGVVGAVQAVAFATLATTWVNVVTLMLAGTATGLLQGAAVAAVSNNTSLTTTDIANTTSVRGTMIYRASA